MFGYFRKRRRRRLRDTPLPGASWDIIDRNVPLVRGMDRYDREELGGIVQVLLHEKTFEGCGGLEITEEIRLTILAHAAVLLLHRETGYYPTLKTILVYPSTYLVPHQEVLPDGTVIEGHQARLGESWYRGSLVLAWDNVRSSAWNHDDGRNVTLHEFAHQLDGVATGMDGAPQLPNLRYGVLGLGDSAYVNFCETARILDERLEALGAQRLIKKEHRRASQCGAS